LPHVYIFLKVIVGLVLRLLLLRFKLSSFAGKILVLIWSLQDIILLAKCLKLRQYDNFLQSSSLKGLLVLIDDMERDLSCDHKLLQQLILGKINSC